MKTIRTFILAGAAFAFLFWSSVGHAATLFVAPAGNDSNAGTEAMPYATMIKANMVATAGDTIYFRAGTYTFTKGTTTCSSQTASISGVTLSASGSAGSLIKYWAYPGEVPVFDFGGMKDSCRIKGILVTGNYIHVKGIELKNVYQNNNLNHESWGIWIQGSNNIFETINVHHIMGAGIFIQHGSNNLVLNCDSHDNLDEMTSNGAGESADGFGCHVGAGETGNVFRGCRAWWNADDGYDFINAFAPCTVEYSWAWYNGYRPGTMTGIGNGNGFKGGGYGLDPSTFPASPVRHTVRACVSFNNKAAGFYANHHPGPLNFHNNTSYGNNPDFNMLGITSGGADVTVGIYRNNVAFSGTLFSNRSGADETFNSWTVSGVTVSAADFQNVSVTGMDAPRQADGSLPVVPNFHLAAGSDLIDKGTDVGLPFAGAAPDLGAFETGLAATGGGAGTGTGGRNGTGGSGAGTGGVADAGAGGVNGSGGNAGNAGAPASGGRGASGGTGGTGTSSGGGTAGSGGTGTGGAQATGGATASGGASGTGGAGVGGTGAPGGCACTVGGGATGGAQASGEVLLSLLLLARVRRPRRRTSARRPLFTSA